VRTTIDLDADVHEIARRRAFEERRSLGSVISELVRIGLEAEPRRHRNLGAFAGLVHMADDFDETPREVLEALEDPIG
jgi:hypothetical protein